MASSNFSRSKQCVYSKNITTSNNENRRTRTLAWRKRNYVCNCNFCFWNLLLEKSDQRKIINKTQRLTT